MGKFTKEYATLVDTITTECFVYPAIDYTKVKLPDPIVIEEAMWDTGADVCVMTQRVATALGCKPYKQIIVDGVHGEEKKDVYLVHVKLPTDDYIMNIETIIGARDDYDFVIGMNVIANGDIALTTADDKTVFSIRIPSEGHIKF